MTVPAECSELEPFTPPVLANLPAPPVFTLRPGSKREMRQYEYALQSEGLQYHGKETFRAELLRALKDLWSPEAYEPNVARLKSYWALVDQKGTPDPAEKEAVNQLVANAARAWKPLAQIAADNSRFLRESLKIVVSMFVVGWKNVDVPYGREAGRVPLDKIDELEEWLQKVEKKAAADKIEGVLAPGTAFVQLCNRAYKGLHLSEDEEKNSSSPPPASPDPNGSTKTPSAKTGAARSKASASSKKARSA